MSKAFTREDDAGLEPPKADRSASHAPHTRMGRAVLCEQLALARAAGERARVADLEARLEAGTIPSTEDSTVASLGAEVTLRDSNGRERVVRLVTAGEVGLVPRGASPTSPVGSAVAGARVGDVVELESGESTVVGIDWP